MSTRRASVVAATEHPRKAIRVAAIPDSHYTPGLITDDPTPVVSIRCAADVRVLEQATGGVSSGLSAIHHWIEAPDAERLVHLSGYAEVLGRSRWNRRSCPEAWKVWAIRKESMGEALS